MDNIKDVVDRVIKSMTRNAPGAHRELERIWEEIISQDERKHSKLLGVNQNQLLVCVDSAAWLYQIRTKQKKILDRIKKDNPEIQTIVFKLGKVS
jgi:hypothetical protein